MPPPCPGEPHEGTPQPWAVPGSHRCFRKLWAQGWGEGSSRGSQNSHHGVYRTRRNGDSTTHSQNCVPGVALPHGLAAGHNLSIPFQLCLSPATALRVLAPFGRPWGCVLAKETLVRVPLDMAGVVGDTIVRSQLWEGAAPPWSSAVCGMSAAASIQSPVLPAWRLLAPY